MTAHEFHEATPEELLAELLAKGPTEWAYVPAPLTRQQRYRLCLIAHETSDPALRAAALSLVRGVP